MIFELKYHELVMKEDIPKLPKHLRDRIKKAIENKLQIQPELFAKSLRKSLKNYRSLRVGDYRVICRIEKNTVLILLIRHRSDAYEKALVRVSK